MVKVAINGFGRIGRNAFKIMMERKDVDVVAINDITDARTLAHLLKYDSSYGAYDKEVTANNNSITVDGRRFQFMRSETRWTCHGGTWEWKLSLNLLDSLLSPKWRRLISNLVRSG